MAKAPDSKEKTLTAAAKLMRQQGYHGAALHDILVAGGAPRGSLYFRRQSRAAVSAMSANAMG